MAVIACRNCGNQWEVKGRVAKTRDKIPWIRSGGMIRVCPQCKTGDRLTIKSENEVLTDAVKNLQSELNKGGANPKLLEDGWAGVRTVAELERQMKALHVPVPAQVNASFPEKMTTRAKAIARYGAIDLASAHWPDEGKWIKALTLPEGWFPNWHVAGTTHVVHAISCNVDIHGPLMAALTEIHSKGLGDVLKTFDGCLNIRAVRGSSSMSTHAYGLGLDINASINPLAGTHGDFTKHLDVVDCFKRQGFSWGGDWNGRKDQMHYSRCWE